MNTSETNQKNIIDVLNRVDDKHDPFLRRVLVDDQEGFICFKNKKLLQEISHKPCPAEFGAQGIVLAEELEVPHIVIPECFNRGSCCIIKIPDRSVRE